MNPRSKREDCLECLGTGKSSQGGGVCWACKGSGVARPEGILRVFDIIVTDYIWSEKQGDFVPSTWKAFRGDSLTDANYQVEDAKMDYPQREGADSPRFKPSPIRAPAPEFRLKKAPDAVVEAGNQTAQPVLGHKDG